MIKVMIEYIHSPRWQNPEHRSIICKVKFSHIKVEIPYAAVPDAHEEYGKEIWHRCMNKEFGEILPYDYYELGKYSIRIETLKYEEPVVLYSDPFLGIEQFFDVVNKENERQSFRSVGIVWASFLEKSLNDAVELYQQVNEINVRIGDFKDKIEKAYKYKIIDNSGQKRSNIIRKIRNTLAHEWKIENDKKMLIHLREIYELDHSDYWVFIPDLDYLLQIIYAESCSKQVGNVKYNMAMIKPTSKLNSANNTTF